MAACVAALAALTLTTTGLGGAAGAATSTKPKSGGQLTYISFLDFKNLDPVNIIGYAAFGGPAVPSLYGGLFYVDRKTLKPVPWFAESGTTTDNGATWTIKLRPNIKFSDGTPYNADALIYNWDRFKDVSLGGSNTAAFTARYASYTKVDDLTVKVVLKNPDSQYLYGLAQTDGENFLGSPAAFDKEGKGFGTAPVAAGPFVLKSYVPGNKIELTRNPTYWDAPRPYLDSITFLTQTDDNQRYNALVSGAVQGSFFQNYDQVAQLKASADASKYATYPGPNVVGAGYQFNTTKPPLDDVNFRKAIWMSLSEPAIHDTFYQGFPNATAFFPEDSIFYTKTSQYPKQDIVAAQKIVNSYFAKTGTSDVTIDLQIQSGSPTEAALGAMEQQQIQRLKGVHVNIVAQTAAQNAASRPAGNFMLTRGGVFGPWPSPMADYFSSTGSLNYGKCNDPKLDATLKKASSSTSFDVQVSAYKQAGVEMAKNMCYFPLVHSTYNVVISKDYKDVQIFNDAQFRPDLIWTTSK